MRLWCNPFSLLLAMRKGLNESDRVSEVHKSCGGQTTHRLPSRKWDKDSVKNIGASTNPCTASVRVVLPNPAKLASSRRDSNNSVVAEDDVGRNSSMAEKGDPLPLSEARGFLWC